ncbi:uncharacterized protein LOC133419505 [Cololabis saira]|uniref:uncharacterized protein LOC133419505 n=1 Tax=Cololabis saira TaxID=129043 RepID=UPI002AD25A80|nr:uncharacterized protein LOC133419505 [Cololabis saira]
MSVCACAVLLGAWRGSGSCPDASLCYESELVDCRARGLARTPRTPRPALRSPPGLPHGAWLLERRGNRLKELLWSLRSCWFQQQILHAAPAGRR